MMMGTCRTANHFEKLYVYIKRYWFLYILAVPGVVLTFIFNYIPMYGTLIAFKKFYIRRGILGSPWVGFKNFRIIFRDPDFYKVLGNTVYINILNLVLSTVFILILVLALNEIRVSAIKRVVQTVVYLPNFISWVIFSGIVAIFLSPSEGAVNMIIKSLGFEPIFFLQRADLFRGLLVVTNIIKSAGFSTIIYLAAIAGINPELYESAIMDGAHRGHMMWHITLPRIKPTIAVLLILSLTGLFSSNFEQVFTLYNPTVYETGDVLSTYMYRNGIMNGRWEENTALGLIFSVVGLILIIITNKFVNKMDVMGIF